jgi:hypothetical protein
MVEAKVLTCQHACDRVSIAVELAGCLGLASTGPTLGACKSATNLKRQALK